MAEFDELAKCRFTYMTNRYMLETPDARSEDGSFRLRRYIKNFEKEVDMRMIIQTKHLSL